MKQAVLRVVFAVVASLLSVFPFLSAVDLLHWLVKVFRGLASFGALLTLIPLAIVELAFVIMVGAYFKGARTRLRLIRKFLTVSGVELFLVFLLEAVRFVTLRLRTGMALASYTDIRPLHYTVAALVCLGLAIALLGVSFLLRRQPAEGA